MPRSASRPPAPVGRRGPGTRVLRSSGGDDGVVLDDDAKIGQAAAVQSPTKRLPVVHRRAAVRTVGDDLTGRHSLDSSRRALAESSARRQSLLPSASSPGLRTPADVVGSAESPLGRSKIVHVEKSLRNDRKHAITFEIKTSAGAPHRRKESTATNKLSVPPLMHSPLSQSFSAESALPGRAEKRPLLHADESSEVKRMHRKRALHADDRHSGQLRAEACVGRPGDTGCPAGPLREESDGGACTMPEMVIDTAHSNAVADSSPAKGAFDPEAEHKAPETSRQSAAVILQSQWRAATARERKHREQEAIRPARRLPRLLQLQIAVYRPCRTIIAEMLRHTIRARFCAVRALAVRLQMLWRVFRWVSGRYDALGAIVAGPAGDALVALADPRPATPPSPAVYFRGVLIAGVPVGSDGLFSDAAFRCDAEESPFVAGSEGMAEAANLAVATTSSAPLPAVYHVEEQQNADLLVKEAEPDVAPPGVSDIANVASGPQAPSKDASDTQGAAILGGQSMDTSAVHALVIAPDQSVTMPHPDVTPDGTQATVPSPTVECEPQTTPADVSAATSQHVSADSTDGPSGSTQPASLRSRERRTAASYEEQFRLSALAQEEARRVLASFDEAAQSQPGERPTRRSSRRVPSAGSGTDILPQAEEKTADKTIAISRNDDSTSGRPKGTHGAAPGDENAANGRQSLRPVRSLSDEAALMQRTLQNTRANGGYRSVDVVMRDHVIVGSPPSSPSRRFCRETSAHRKWMDPDGAAAATAASWRAPSVSPKPRRRVQWSAEIGFADGAFGGDREALAEETRRLLSTQPARGVLRRVNVEENSGHPAPKATRERVEVKRVRYVPKEGPVRHSRARA